jgi:hypothetical protein
MAGQQANFSITVVNPVLPARRAKANQARKQPVSSPERQLTIDRVRALENVLKMNKELKKTT